MFRIILCAISFLCLLATGLLLWQSHTLPEHFPHGTLGWLNAWFELFDNPIMAATILMGAFFITVASACISELLVGLLLTTASMFISILCLLGFMGNHYPSVAEHLNKIFR